MSEGGFEGGCGSSKSSTSTGVACDRLFDAAMGPLWLQALAAYAGTAHAGGASSSSSSSSSSSCERRVILNCEVSTITAPPTLSLFNVSLGLSNGETVFIPSPTRLHVHRSIRLTPLQLPAHVVVVAIGVAPAMAPGFFRGGQAPDFADDGSICVDACMQSSVACVLAAGDCCSMRQAHSLHWFQMRLWEQAAVMGAQQQLHAIARCR